MNNKKMKIKKPNFNINSDPLSAEEINLLREEAVNNRSRFGHQFALLWTMFVIASVVISLSIYEFIDLTSWFLMVSILILNAFLFSILFVITLFIQDVIIDRPVAESNTISSSLFELEPDHLNPSYAEWMELAAKDNVVKEYHSKIDTMGRLPVMGELDAARDLVLIKKT